MLFNAQRQRVRDWSPGQISTCPDCQQSLIARRGEYLIWHWAHYPQSSRRAPVCGHCETEWHLRWKDAYSRLPGWTVEAPVHGLRIDAANLATGSLREFVHTLTPRYRVKHSLLASLSLDVRWIFDGATFASRRMRPLDRGGVARLLTPRAYAMHEELQCRCWVHWDGRLWREWKDNVWYPRADDAAAKLLSAFEADTERSRFDAA